MKKKLLQKIKDQIAAKKIEKAELAKTLGIGRTTLWRYLENKKDIPLETFLKICEVLEIKLTLKK